MFNNIFKSIALVLASSFLFMACSSTTKINSLPEGAKVYVDGEYMGQTPYSLTDKKPAWGTTQIKLKKDGYKDFNVTVQKGEEFSTGACIGGVLLLFPFAWIMEYKPYREFEMEKSEDNVAKK